MRPVARFVLGFVVTWIALLLAAMIFGASSCHASKYDYLTTRDLARIRFLLPMYEEAACLAGVPVLALPAIHIMESDLRGVNKEQCDHGATRCIGGPFMLDCGGEGTEEFDRNVRAFEVRVAAKFGIVPAPMVRNNLTFACLCAAQELRDKARGQLFNKRGEPNLDVLADALWGYNGRAGPSWRKSCYVNNHPKAGRQLVIRITVGQEIVAYPDPRPGAIVLYREIARRLHQ